MTKAQVIALLIAVTVKAKRFNSLLPALMTRMAGAFAHYNRVGYSPAGLKTLEYDVQNAYSITNRELREAKTAFAKAQSQQNNDEDDDDDAVVSLTQKAQTAVFTEADEEVKKEVKLRERYPFLNDPDTPHIGKFYELIGINGTAYHQVLEARAELFKNLVPATEEGAEDQVVPMTNEEIFDVAIKAVENFELNIEGIEELDYYRDNGELLGKHPIFEDIVLEKKVADLTEAAIGKRYTNLKGYVNREFNKHKKAILEEKKAVFVEKIKTFEKEIRLIEARLEVKPEAAFASKLEQINKAAAAGDGENA